MDVETGEEPIVATIISNKDAKEIPMIAVQGIKAEIIHIIGVTTILVCKITPVFAMTLTPQILALMMTLCVRMAVIEAIVVVLKLVHPNGMRQVTDD